MLWYTPDLFNLFIDNHVLLQVTFLPLPGEWAWRLFEATIPLSACEGEREVELVCKAVDTSMNQQPDNADAIWNMMGLVHNAWHRVTVTLPDTDEE